MARNIFANGRPDKVLRLDAMTEQWPFPLHLLSLSPSLHGFPPVTQSGSHTSIKGFSRTSISSTPNEHMLLDSSCVYESQCELFEQAVEKYYGSGSDKLDYNGNLSVQQVGSVTGHEPEKRAKQTITKKEREDSRSKNLHTERNRRFRIQNGILTLRSLVPKITKVIEKKKKKACQLLQKTAFIHL